MLFPFYTLYTLSTCAHCIPPPDVAYLSQADVAHPSQAYVAHPSQAETDVLYSTALYGVSQSGGNIRRIPYPSIWRIPVYGVSQYMGIPVYGVSQYMAYPSIWRIPVRRKQTSAPLRVGGGGGRSCCRVVGGGGGQRVGGGAKRRRRPCCGEERAREIGRGERKGGEQQTRFLVQSCPYV